MIFLVLVLVEVAFDDTVPHSLQFFHFLDEATEFWRAAHGLGGCFIQNLLTFLTIAQLLNFFLKLGDLIP